MNTEKAALSHKFKQVADYAAASFMNPKNLLKVFGSIDEYYIRFQAALPQTNDDSSDYALIYKAGNEGYLNCESGKGLREILYELSGIQNKKHTRVVSCTLSPLVLLTILGACDVVMQNRYEGGWFTASSVENTFDLSGDGDFKRVGAPVAEVASDIILSEASIQDISEVLNEMAGREILNSDEIDSIPIYSFCVEYRYIPNIFTGIKNRLAVFRYDERGVGDIYYMVSKEAETWAFTVEKGRGTIERIDETRLNQILDTILAADVSKAPAQTQIVRKFCKNCGSPANPTANFCSNCGADV